LIISNAQDEPAVSLRLANGIGNKQDEN
jgi:hypothetical protein